MSLAFPCAFFFFAYIWRNDLPTPFFHFIIWVMNFIVEIKITSIFWVLDLYQIHDLQMFFLFLSNIFILLISFEVQKFLILMKSNLLFLLLLVFSVLYLKINCLTQFTKIYSCVIFLALIFRLMVHSELIFVYWII
jgi:hypothetical protein